MNVDMRQNEKYDAIIVDRFCEAPRYLPLPEPAAQPAETGYQNVENSWKNIDADKLARTIARVFQLPERPLRREITSPKGERQWQKFLETNGFG